MNALKEDILKPASIRHNNYRSVLMAIRANGACTIAKVAEHLDLSKTAISKAFIQLTKLGYIQCVGRGASSATGGKPPDIYAIMANFRYTCTITFYHDVIIVYINNFSGEKVSQTSFPLPNLETTPEEFVSICYDWVTRSFALQEIDIQKLCGVILLHNDDPYRNDYMSSFFKSSHKIAFLKAELSNRFNMSDIVYVENSKNMRGYAELHSDECLMQKLVVVVSVLKEEVTGCILNHGKILSGANADEANFAHMPTDITLRNQCTCGRRGCFASVCLKDPILKAITNDLRSGEKSSLREPYENRTLGMVTVVKAAQDGDALAKRHMDRVLDNYENLIYMLAMTLNPDAIILQVGMRGQEYHERELNKRFQAMELPNEHLKDSLRITASSVDPFDSTMLGAAYYCIDSYLDNPICFDE